MYLLQLGFKFVPSQLGIVESFWKLVVAEQNISIPFLLVGNAIEPGVSFDRSFLSFKPLLIGVCGQEGNSCVKGGGAGMFLRHFFGTSLKACVEK